MAKGKAQLDNLCPPVRVPVASSAAFLLSSPALVSCFRSSVPLLSNLGSSICLSPLPAYLKTPIALLSYLMPALVSRSLTVLLFLSVLSLTPPHLISTTLRIFKQALSYKFLHDSTSSAESFCLIPPLSLFLDKTDCKRTFDITFINFCLLAGNHG